MASQIDDEWLVTFSDGSSGVFTGDVVNAIMQDEPDQVVSVEPYTGQPSPTPTPTPSPSPVSGKSTTIYSLTGPASANQGDQVILFLTAANIQTFNIDVIVSGVADSTVLTVTPQKATMLPGLDYEFNVGFTMPNHAVTATIEITVVVGTAMVVDNKASIGIGVAGGPAPIGPAVFSNLGATYSK